MLYQGQNMTKKKTKFTLDGIQTIEELENLIKSIKTQLQKDNINEKDTDIAINKDTLFLYTPYTAKDLELIEAEKIRIGLKQLIKLSKNYEKVIKEKEAKISRIESKRVNFKTVNESLENSITKNKESLLAYQEHQKQLKTFLESKTFSSLEITKELEKHYEFSPIHLHNEINFFGLKITN